MPKWSRGGVHRENVWRINPLLLLLAVSFLTLFLSTGAVCESSPAGHDRGISVDGSSSGLLGERAKYLFESASALDLAGAQAALASGAFRAGDSQIAGFGIARPPLWMHLQFINSTDRSLPYQLRLGMPWLDSLDVWLVHRDIPLQSWHLGDSRPGADYLVPGWGSVLPVDLPPGRSELFVRVHTEEALILPVSLLSSEDFGARKREYRYGYGLFYGFLLAFIAYNLMLYGGVRERSHLYYALYLLSFVMLSWVYTGHGFSWWWPNNGDLQFYGLTFSMISYVCTGLLFACRFLHIQKLSPAAARWIVGASVLVAMASVTFAIADLRHFLIYTAYGYFLVSTLVMLLLGIYAYRSARIAARFFLAAVSCSMLGLALGLLASLGVIPSANWSIYSVEVGLVLEAIFLSLALGSQMRQQSMARLQAEKLARIDCLTGLLNRRAFMSDATALWSTAVRHGRPISAILIDIDFFKKFNDRLGHDYGDRILQQVAGFLQGSCRDGDILARWGGEEFVLLLAETDLAQACVFGERIRGNIELQQIAEDIQGAPLTVSIGAAELKEEVGLNELVEAADRELYMAKRGGRNRVAPALMEMAMV